MVHKMFDVDVLLRESDSFRLKAADKHAQIRKDEIIKELQQCADIYFEQGNLSVAKHCYMQAAELTENSLSWPYTGLGVIALEQGQLKEAQTAFTSASQCDDDCADAYCGLARVYQTQGTLKHAAVMYNNAIDIDPDNLIAITGLFQVSLQTGEFAKIIEYMRDYLKRNGEDTTIMFCLAVLYAKTNQSCVAAVVLERIIKLDPDRQDAAVLLASISEKIMILAQRLESLGCTGDSTPCCCLIAERK